MSGHGAGESNSSIQQTALRATAYAEWDRQPSRIDGPMTSGDWESGESSQMAADASGQNSGFGVHSRQWKR